MKEPTKNHGKGPGRNVTVVKITHWNYDDLTENNVYISWKPFHISVETLTTYQCLAWIILNKWEKVKNDKYEYKTKDYPSLLLGWWFTTKNIPGSEEIQEIVNRYLAEYERVRSELSFTDVSDQALLEISYANIYLVGFLYNVL